jgi:UDP-N-acetylmuramate--alanine ligase
LAFALQRVGLMRSARYHFSGIAGAGMHPLALLMRARGHEVQGSDRSFDQGKNEHIAAGLRRLGIVLKPQDGRAVTRGIDRVVFSAAVEADTPEMRAARELGIELVPRPALLAEVVNAGHPGIAIAGTSGKSTITGMVAWITRQAAVPATVLGGAALVGDGSGGCFLAGPPDGPVVVEACESDGTLLGYRPMVGLIHNISRDHDELDALRAQFAAFAGNCTKLLVNAACAEAAPLGRARGALTYGAAPDADAPLRVVGAGPHRASGVLGLRSTEIKLELPQPGVHNLENAAAAALVAVELGIAPATVEGVLPRFPGVARRFEVIGTTAAGIRVVDDYAHNGQKIRAAMTTAQAGCDRLIAVFQPHGFGPARFLRPELGALLPQLLRSQDRFCYLEIFYAGGNVTRDISSRMLTEDLPPRPGCGYAVDHAAALRWIQSEARPGDTVLIMGARDPALPRLARAVFGALQTDRSPGSDLSSTRRAS